MNALGCYHRPTTSRKPPGKHVLVYDGDCAFCWTSVSFVQRHARNSLVLIPFEDLRHDEMLSDLEWPQIERSAHYITPEGREYHGGESIVRAMRSARGGVLLAPFNLPGLSLLRELVYGVVANNRPFFSSVTNFLQRREAASCSIEPRSEAEKKTIAGREKERPG